jgi:hypothetical protein
VAVRPQGDNTLSRFVTRVVKIAEVFPDEQIVATLPQELTWMSACDCAGKPHFSRC